MRLPNALLTPAIVGLLLLAGCGGSQENTLEEAEETTEDYVTALGRGDEDACDLETEKMAEEFDQYFGASDCRERLVALESLLDGMNIDLDDAEYDARSAGDDKALVTVEYPSSTGEVYELIYEDGSWLVNGDVTGDDESETAAEPEADTPETLLSLSEGASIVLPGNVEGMSSDESPFTVVFDTLTCAERIPDASYDDNYESADLVAEPGNQVCIVELAVTNDGRKPGTFSSVNDANLRTADGIEFSARQGDFDDQGYLHAKDRSPSYTTDEVQPGQTKYDVIAYELPADAEPVALAYTTD